MKCPLTIKTEFAVKQGVIAHGADCLKEECAWWEERIQLCTVRSLGARIRSVEVSVEAIAEKLEKEGNP